MSVFDKSKKYVFSKELYKAEKSAAGNDPNEYDWADEIDGREVKVCSLSSGKILPEGYGVTPSWCKEI